MRVILIIQKKKKVFSKNVKIHRHQYSSKVIVISKFLKDDLVIGLSPEFSLFVDERFSEIKMIKIKGTKYKIKAFLAFS